MRMWTDLNSLRIGSMRVVLWTVMKLRLDLASEGLVTVRNN